MIYASDDPPDTLPDDAPTRPQTRRSSTPPALPVAEAVERARAILEAARHDAGLPVDGPEEG